MLNMTYSLVKPRYTLNFDSKDYDFEGTFALVEAVEYAVKDNIVSITTNCIEAKVGDISKILYAIFSTCGYKEVTLDKIREYLLNIGIASDDYVILTIHIHTFLMLCISKPSEREAVAKKLGELLDGIISSRGEIIDNSVLVS